MFLFDICELKSFEHMLTVAKVVQQNVQNEKLWFENPITSYQYSLKQIPPSVTNCFKTLLMDTEPGHNAEVNESPTVDDLSTLASNRWISNLIIQSVANLINSSNANVYVRNLTMIMNFEREFQKIVSKYQKCNDTKVCFFMHVGYNSSTNETFLSSFSLKKCGFLKIYLFIQIYIIIFF